MASTNYLSDKRKTTEVYYPNNAPEMSGGRWTIGYISELRAQAEYERYGSQRFLTNIIFKMRGDRLNVSYILYPMRQANFHTSAGLYQPLGPLPTVQAMYDLLLKIFENDWIAYIFHHNTREKGVVGVSKVGVAKP